MKKILAFTAGLILVVGWLVGCGYNTTPTATPMPASVTELKYKLIEFFGGIGAAHSIWYCDPDQYPVQVPGREQEGAVQKFAQIAQDMERFQVILRHLGLQNISEFTDEQKLLIYREDKKLDGVPLTSADHIYRFDLKIAGESSDHEDMEVVGTISDQGEIKVASQTKIPSYGCPICLLPETRIDTPDGQVAVKDLKSGASVWTVDRDGTRVSSVIVETVRRPVSPGNPIVHVHLKDGRELYISGRHPTTDGRSMGQLLRGDKLDGSEIDFIEHVPFNGPATYDILPGGQTGFYWANGILVKSTLGSSSDDGR